jgi:acetyltransferase-like isoleucine patch superfamily enzyme
MSSRQHSNLPGLGHLSPISRAKPAPSCRKHLRRAWHLLKLLRRDCEAWTEAIVMHLPGSSGVAMRVRYLRSRVAALGDNCLILEGIRVYHKAGLSIGDRVAIASGVTINATAGVSMGNNTLVGPGVKIWSINHCYADTRIPIMDQGFAYGPVVLEDDVWVAANAVILPGVTVHHGAIVAAGAVVSKDVPPLCLVGGVPARAIGRRGDSIICEPCDGADAGRD